MVDRLIKPDVIRSPWLLALLALFVPGIGSAALAPAMAPAMENAGDKTDTAARDAVPGAVRIARPQGLWVLPHMRIGGALSYNMRRDTSDGKSRMQQSQDAMLTTRFDGFLWQPWVAEYTCTASVSVSRNQNESDGQSNSGQSVSTAGNGQLRLLARSSYPFEAHFSKYDGRYSNDLSLSQTYAGQSFGFSQNLFASNLQASAAWDRNTQNGGVDQQDTARINVSAFRNENQLSIDANLGRNSHEELDTTQTAQQNNLSVMHSTAPTDTVSLQNMLSLNQSSYKLERSRGTSNVRQLSSVAFWRPEEVEMTVTGSARLLTLQNESLNTFDSSGNGYRATNGNFNVGMNYDGIENIRINAGGNLNLTQVQGVRSSTTNQNAGIAYQPEAYDLGGFRYNWMTSANAGHSTGAGQSNSDLSTQLGHYLGRSITLSERTSISMNANQGITVSARKSSARKSGAPSADATTGTDANDRATKYLTHGAAMGWNLSTPSASASAQLSASDGRSLGGTGEYFQSINFQASSNMPASKTASWSGNFTIQAVRQGGAELAGTGLVDSRNGKVITSSSGSVSYQQQRLFGIRRLRLVSDLRLNSQALLPLLGGPQDQEYSAWENRFDYAIGRMQFRLNFLLSKMVTPATGVDPVTGAGVGSRTGHVAKSVSFSMSRAIGSL